MTLYDLNGNAEGTGGAAGGLGVLYLFSGAPKGTGTLSDALLTDLGGTAGGTGDAVASPLYILDLAGETYGRGAFVVSVPEPLLGLGDLAAYMDVVQVPAPICPQFCACERHDCDDCEEYHSHFFRDCDPDRYKPWRQCTSCRSRHALHRYDRELENREEYEWTRTPQRNCRCFCWLHVFGRGDLEVFLQDPAGNPGVPVFIGYTLMMVSSTGIMHQVGPTDRKPASEDVGKFYVTGTAGENGQPGCWAVRWRYQRTFGAPIVERIEQFTVKEHSQHPLDRTLRQCKYGWDL